MAAALDIPKSAWINKQRFTYWPADAVQATTPREIHAMYEQGFAGCWRDEEARGRLESKIRSAGGFMDGDRIVHDAGLADSYAGQLVLPYLHVEQLYPGSWPSAAQVIGDCFLAGTLVRMADGNERPIDQIEVGEYVQTHTGAFRPVEQVIVKDFDGTLVTATVAGYERSLTATSDHRCICFKSGDAERGVWDWKPLGAMGLDDSLCLATQSANVANLTLVGQAVKIVQLSTRHFTGKVYCLQVAEDHSFVAEGFAVHNCVAHGNRTAAKLTWCAEIVAGLPDEVTGLIEGPPEVDPIGVKTGLLHPSAIWWYRGYNGDGWNIDSCADVLCHSSALWLCNNYPELGIDLRTYNGNVAAKYGRQAPPSAITSAGQKHLVRTATVVESFEALRDFLGNGNGIASDGDEGFSSTRDANGVAKRSGYWAHDMPVLGADDRAETKKIYGEPLVLMGNNWGVWNGGPRTVLGTNIQIPEGAYWARWSDLRRRRHIAYAGAMGWAKKKLPPLVLNLG